VTPGRVLELVRRLRSAGITATLDGGWGVDALLGRETRAHEDLDLVVALGDFARIRDALAPLGFALHEDHLPVRFVLRNADEQLDFHTVAFDAEGGGVQPQPGGGSFRYPPEGFVVGRVLGKRCRASARRSRSSATSATSRPTRTRATSSRCVARSGFRFRLPTHASSNAGTPQRRSGRRSIACSLTLRPSPGRTDPRTTVRTVSITAREAEALTRWVLREKPTHTIEIGLAFGVSALAICAGLVEAGNPSARHVVLDPFQDRFAHCGLQVLDEAGIASLVEFHARPSQLALPAFLQDGRRFDFAFVDGNHRFDGVLVDLFYLGRLLRPGGIVFLDDYDLPGVRRAVSFFVSNLGWRLEEAAADDRHAWAVVRTAAGEDERDFRYFVEF
jgi:predicted O-methyltransferase YrrM